MNDPARDRHNIQRFLEAASHTQLGLLARALAEELTARGLRGDAEGFQLARLLEEQRSAPRAEASLPRG